MNLLIVTESFPPHAGGSGWSTYYLARALKKQKLNVFVSKINGKDKSYKEIDILSIRSKNDLKKVIKQNNIDLIHAQHRKSTLLSLGCGVPVVSTIRDYWHISFDGTAFDPITEKNYFKETFGTIFDSLSGAQYPLAVKFFSITIAPALYLRTKYSQFMLGRCAKLICNSSHTYKTAKMVFPNMDCEIIPNILDTGKMAKVKPHKFDQKTVLYVGKLTKNKGAHLLVDTARLLKTKSQFIIVGEGPLKKTMQMKARQHNLNFRFLDYIPNDKVLSMMKGADALVLPALWHEPLGRTHLEGIGVGAKIITTNTGGTPDIIEDKKNGLFFDKTPEDLAVKIDLILGDKMLSNKLSKHAQKSAERFSDTQVTTKFLEFYKR